MILRAFSQIALGLICVSACASSDLGATIASAHQQAHEAVVLLSNDPAAAASKLRAVESSLDPLAAEYPAARLVAEISARAANQVSSPEGQRLARLAEAQLATLEQLTRSSGPQAGQDTSTRETIAQVLNRREFRQANAAGMAQHLTNAIMRWMLHIMGSIVDLLGAHSLAVRLLSWTLLISLCVVLVILLARLVDQLLARFDRRQAHARFDQGQPVGQRLGPGASDEALSQARRLAEKGDWTEALRYAFLSLLLALDALHLMDYRGESTNWEYIRQLRVSAPEPLLGEVREATLLFEGRWYGQRLATQTDFETMLLHLRQARNCG